MSCIICIKQLSVLRWRVFIKPQALLLGGYYIQIHITFTYEQLFTYEQKHIIN